MPAKTSIRWWPAAVIFFAGLGFLLWARLGGDRTGQERFVQSLITVFLTLVALLLWFLLLSRLRWTIRLLGLSVVAVAVLALTQSVRIRGVSGDLVPILAWRWTPQKHSAPSTPHTGLGAVRGAEPALFDYPAFLGPHGDATVRGIRLARDWSARPPREVWRRPIGAGWSAFSVVGNLAVTQEQRGEEELVVAYDLTTGEILWVHADPGRYETTIAGVGPRANPTIADDRVYTVGGVGLLNALDLATGETIWSRDILKDNGAANPEWGKSCSPLVLDDLVVVSAGGPAGRSLVAYHRETGQPIWHGGSDRSGYSSPKVATLAGVRQILILNKASVAAHSPETGEVLWQYPWSSDQPNVAQPVVLPGDRLLVSSGYGVGSKLLQISHDPGGGLQASLVWESPRLKAKFTNVVVHEGYIYGLDDGTLVCLDPETGRRCWKRGRYGHGQMILVEDLLLITTEKGEVVLVEPSPEEHRELGRFTALTGKSWNNPALAGAYLLVRNHREAAMFELPLESS